MKAMAASVALSESATGGPLQRRVDLPLAVLCAATSIGLALDVAAPVTAALLAVSILVVPGAFVVDLVRPADRSSG